MPSLDFTKAGQDALAGKCAAPYALYIMPGDDVNASSDTYCDPVVTHSFQIQILVQCVRDVFQLAEKDGTVYLKGEYMDLAVIRKAVKKSVSDFNKKISKDPNNLFERIVFVKQQMLYPAEEGAFIATALEYKVTIF